MTARRFGLLLFSTDPQLAAAATDAGIDGLIVDWERRGKGERQAGADTEINTDTVEDLRRVRRATDAPVICRINPVGPTTAEEVESAIGEGADEILLPMVRCSGEVEGVLELGRGRIGVGILIETASAVDRVDSFAALPLSRVYVGLNDLAIERQSSNIFQAVADGTVEAIRTAVTLPFGFGGLTLPDRGWPIPCRLLMGEMTRLDCQFSFLRRSFHRDRGSLPLPGVIARIRAGLADAAARPEAAATHDQREFARAVTGWDCARAV